MEAEARKAFVAGYGTLLRTAWTKDGAFKKRLLADPTKVVKEFGLNPGTAKVAIVESSAEGKGSIDDVVRLWEDGKKAGSIMLYVPFTMPKGAADMELTEADLEAVAGGEGDCCCCCSPCCTC